VESGWRHTFARRHGAALTAAVTTLVLLLILTAFLPRRSVERVPPPPSRWFDDRAGLVSSEFASAKSTYLQSYLLQALHLPILVAIEPTVPASGIEDYTATAANAWKIGAQGADNGVVLFVFPSARTIRLEIGYGLEGLIPDIDAKRLVDTTLLPTFAVGRYEDGFEDFFTAIVRQLEEHADEAAKADKPIGIVAFAADIVRQVPRLARQAWQLFRNADFTGRVVLALFGAAFAAVFGYGLSGVAIGIWALVQLPWRIATGTAWRGLDRQKLSTELAPAQFVRRPPASLVAVVEELRLGEILWGVLSLAGIVVGIAFLGLGSEAVMGGHGQFSGGGVTEVWPLPAASLNGRP
jgi:uncharacterized membrane protein YgcG